MRKTRRYLCNWCCRSWFWGHSAQQQHGLLCSAIAVAVAAPAARKLFPAAGSYVPVAASVTSASADQLADAGERVASSVVELRLEHRKLLVELGAQVAQGQKTIVGLSVRLLRTGELCSMQMSNKVESGAIGSNQDQEVKEFPCAWVGIDPKYATCKGDRKK